MWWGFIWRPTKVANSSGNTALTITHSSGIYCHNKHTIIITNSVVSVGAWNCSSKLLANYRPNGV